MSPVRTQKTYNIYFYVEASPVVDFRVHLQEQMNIHRRRIISKAHYWASARVQSLTKLRKVSGF
ncbi:hypothetical protein HYW35_03350 [Candidatus Saccharibacteria bacterium]|nr:hypothetical protein [Candidatus Saccharibacteria bacterium]